jgi:excisionase family DNA binding protein
MRHFPYPVTIRILNGHIEVQVPDLGINYSEVRFDAIQSAEQLGMLVLEVIKKAKNRCVTLELQKKPIPAPSKPRGVFEVDESLQEPLLTTKQVQELLQVSHETVRRLANSGKLPSIKTQGNHRRFLKSEVNKLLQQQARLLVKED